MAETIEKRVAETILQQPTEIKVGSKTYEVAPPSVATIILVSQYVAKLPRVKFSKDRVLEDTLLYAQDCSALGNIVAVLILGAKVINADIAKRRGFFGRIKRLLGFSSKSLLERTAAAVLEGVTPAELHHATIGIMRGMQVADFFGLTTFLCEVNLTKPTKVEEPTACGQS